MKIQLDSLESKNKNYLFWESIFEKRKLYKLSLEELQKKKDRQTLQLSIA